MNKKSLNAKEVTKKIKSELDQGVSRLTILNALCEIYYDKKSIAKLIASTPDPLKRTKYQTLNNILLGLLVITIITKILIGMAVLSTVSLYLIPAAFLLPIISILFAFEVAKFRGYIYKILGILAIAGILKMLSNIGKSDIILLSIDVCVSLIIACLAFFIGAKVFPNYGLFGPKKGSDNEILLL
jgi:hypothetical protein